MSKFVKRLAEKHPSPQGEGTGMRPRIALEQFPKTIMPSQYTNPLPPAKT